MLFIHYSVFNKTINRLTNITSFSSGESLLLFGCCLAGLAYIFYWFFQKTRK